jgi:5-formyltetrahydrofolate cyclo-ligase
MQSKTELRKQALHRRKQIDKGVRASWEKAIQGHIAGSLVFKKAKVVALYAPIHGEVDVLPLWKTGKKIMVFPKVQGNTLQFYPAVSENDLAKGGFGIPEPIASQGVDVDEIDLMLVPGLMFDHFGCRIGYGKGFYDRVLTLYPDVATMGPCFDEFFVEGLPAESWDARVDFVVTQSGIFNTESEVRK